MIDLALVLLARLPLSGRHDGWNLRPRSGDGQGGEAARTFGWLAASLAAQPVDFESRRGGSDIVATGCAVLASFN